MDTQVIAVCLLLLTVTHADEYPIVRSVRLLEQTYEATYSIIAWPLQYANLTFDERDYTDAGSSDSLFDTSPSIITVNTLVWDVPALIKPVAIRDKVIVAKEFIILDESFSQRVSFTNVTLIAKLVLLDSALQLTNCSIISDYVKIMATKLTGITVVSRLSTLVVDSFSNSLVVSDSLELSQRAHKIRGPAMLQRNVVFTSKLRIVTGYSNFFVHAQENAFLFHSCFLKGSNYSFKENIFVGENLLVTNKRNFEANELQLDNFMTFNFVKNHFYLEVISHMVSRDGNTVVEILNDASLVENDLDYINEQINSLFTVVRASSTALGLEDFRLNFLKSSNLTSKLMRYKIIDQTNNEMRDESLVRLGIRVQWSAGDFWLGISTLLVGMLPAMFAPLFPSHPHDRTYYKLHPSLFRFNTTVQFNRQFFMRVQENLQLKVQKHWKFRNTDCIRDRALSSWINLEWIDYMAFPADRAQDEFLTSPQEWFSYRSINYFGNQSFVLKNKLVIAQTMSFNFGLLGIDNLAFENVTVIAEKVRFMSLQSDLSARYCLIVADEVLFDLLGEKSHVSLNFCTIIAKNVWLKSKQRLTNYQLATNASASLSNSKIFAQKVKLTGSSVKFSGLFLAAKELDFNFSSWILLDSVIIAKKFALKQHGRHLYGSRKITASKLIAKSFIARGFESVNRDNVLVADKVVLQCEDDRTFVIHAVSDRNATLYHPHCSSSHGSENARHTAPLNFTNERLQRSQVYEILLQAFERSADSILSFTLNPTKGTIKLQNHLFDLLPSVQYVMFSGMNICTANVHRYVSQPAPMLLSDLFSGFKVSFTLSISDWTKSLTRTITTRKQASGFLLACEARKTQCQEEVNLNNNNDCDTELHETAIGTENEHTTDCDSYDDESRTDLGTKDEQTEDCELNHQSTKNVTTKVQQTEDCGTDQQSTNDVGKNTEKTGDCETHKNCTNDDETESKKIEDCETDQQSTNDVGKNTEQTGDCKTHKKCKNDDETESKEVEDCENDQQDNATTSTLVSEVNCIEDEYTAVQDIEEDSLRSDSEISTSSLVSSIANEVQISVSKLSSTTQSNRVSRRISPSQVNKNDASQLEKTFFVLPLTFAAILGCLFLAVFLLAVVKTLYNAIAQSRDRSYLTNSAFSAALSKGNIRQSPNLRESPDTVVKMSSVGGDCDSQPRRQQRPA